MNLRQIEVFRAVFSAQSISGGARQLSISQPSVSRMIQHLQKQLGYALFTLHQGRIVPSLQASALFAETNGLFERVQRVSDLALRLRSGHGEHLAVLAFYSAAMQAVPRALHAVARRFPDAALSLDIKNPAEQIEAVLRGDADIGIAGNVPSLPDLEQRLLGHDVMVAVLPANHPLAARRVVSLAAVAALPCIAGPGTSPVGKVLREVFAARGLAFEARVAVGSPVPVFELVRLMQGVGLLGAMAVRGIGPEDGLVVRPLEVELGYPVSAFWSTIRVQGQATKLFVDLLAADFARKPRRAKHAG